MKCISKSTGEEKPPGAGKGAEEHSKAADHHHRGGTVRTRTKVTGAPDRCPSSRSAQPEMGSGGGQRTETKSTGADGQPLAGCVCPTENSWMAGHTKTKRHTAVAVAPPENRRVPPSRKNSRATEESILRGRNRTTGDSKAIISPFGQLLARRKWLTHTKNVSNQTIPGDRATAFERVAVVVWLFLLFVCAVAPLSSAGRLEVHLQAESATCLLNDTTPSCGGHTVGMRVFVRDDNEMFVHLKISFKSN